MKKKLTKKAKASAKKWLETASCYTCPFPHFDGYTEITSCNICESWFPRCASGGCPCQQYAKSTVIRRFKEMIK